MSADGPPGPIAREAFEAVLNLVGVKGSRDPADSVRSGRLTKLYTTAGAGVGERWIRRLGGEAMGLLERPGKRVANAEAALARMIEFIERAEVEATRLSAEYVRRSEDAYAQARAATEACAVGGGFSLFKNKDQKNLRGLLSALAHYANCRAAEEAQVGTVRFFRKLKAGLEDRQRDLSICRQRLTNLRRALEIPETAGASICGGPSPTVELLLPDGGEEVEWAAKRFVETVKPAAYVELDRALQALVLDPKGGLMGACQKSGDFIRELADPLIDQTSAFLGTLLPVTDVSEFTTQQKNWGARLKKSFDRAAPTVPGLPDREALYLLVPETAAGARVGASAIGSGAFGRAHVVAAPRSNEITFCRELRLRPADVRAALQYCRESYEERAARPAPSPHARFDVVEWLPLDV
jgi:hypothetical protein